MKIMDLQLSQEDRLFSEQAEEFVRKQLPDVVKRKVLEHRPISKDDVAKWHNALFKKGWVAPNWPKVYGGTEWSALRQHIFDEIGCAEGAPRLSPFGINMIGPVLISFGTQFQKDRFLPKILSGGEWWCQGYSEPGSGSDLASLKTRAELKDGKYIVNGQKTWTTQAHWADMMFCLVLT